MLGLVIEAARRHDCIIQVNAYASDNVKNSPGRGCDEALQAAIVSSQER
jgi:hypothetical protein